MDAPSVVKRLVRLTQEGRLKWERYPVKGSLIDGTEEIVDCYFFSKYNGHNLRAYQARYRNFYEEDKFVWDNENRLETVDENDLMMWRFPITPWTGNLLDAVIYQTANVDTMLKDLMSDEPE